MSSQASPDIDEFIEFVIALGDPQIARERSGAAPGDIERLRQLAGHPLPPLYLGFLREFGARSLVFVGGDGRQGVRDLLRYLEAPAEPIPRGSVVICTPAIEPATLLVYREGSAEEPSVVHGDETEAPSFAHQLYRRGWSAALWPNQTQLTIQGGDAQVVARSAERAGFERLWFSGGRAVCLDDGATRLLVEQQGTVARAFVFSRRSASRDRIADWLVRRHGAHRPGRP